MTLATILCDLASRVPPLGRAGPVSVLCYHGVGTTEDRGPLRRFAVSERSFETHLALVAASGRRAAGLRDVAHDDAGGPAVVLTFDDNLPSHLARAAPMLRDAGLPGVFFLNPAELDRPGALGRRDVGALLAAGMEVGAHSATHRVASAMREGEFAREVAACATFLGELGMPLTWAYPGGHIGSYGAAHERILREHGFAVRFSTLEGPCRPADATRAHGRYVIRRDSTPRYVRAAIDGGLQVMALAKRARALVR